jgi:hypothetical protein
MNRLVLIVACAGWIAACDLGGTPPPLPPPAHALGQVCDSADSCPDWPVHACVTLSVGSQVQGYCSPSCSTDQDCRNGYDGPSGGTPYCVNPSAPNTCTIECEAPTDCPDGLDCVSTGGPSSFCVVPAQSLHRQVKTPAGSV